MQKVTVKKGYYKDVVEKFYLIPDNARFVKTDMGSNIMHTGHHNYLTCMYKTDFDRYWVEVSYEYKFIDNYYELDDIVVCQLSDALILEDEEKWLISVDEFNRQWRFDNYYVALWSTKLELASIMHIFYVKSLAQVDVCDVNLKNQFTGDDAFAIMLPTVDFKNLITSDCMTSNFGRTVVKKNNTIKWKFSDCFSYVLAKCREGYGDPVMDEFDSDYVKKAFKEGKYNEVEKMLNFEKAED